jgi:hypothetical protein
MGDIAQRGNRLTFARGGRAGFQDGGSPHTKDKQKSPKKKFITGFGSKGKSRMPEGIRIRQVDPRHRGYKKGGRIGKFGGGRTNLLEELGRVEAEPSNRNRRAEISRVHGELNRGYAKGGRAGFASAGQVLKHAKKLVNRVTHEVPTGPHTDVRRRKINPSFRNPDVESGRTKEWKRKHGGFKGIAKDVVKGFGKALSKKDGGRIGLKKGGKSDKKWMQKVSASIKKRGTKGKCTPITKPGCTGRAKALAKTFKKIAAKRKAKG